jgi:hypothetical protein
MELLGGRHSISSQPVAVISKNNENERLPKEHHTSLCPLKDLQTTLSVCWF